MSSASQGWIPNSLRQASAAPKGREPRMHVRHHVREWSGGRTGLRCESLSRSTRIDDDIGSGGRAGYSIARGVQIGRGSRLPCHKSQEERRCPAFNHDLGSVVGH